MSWAGEATVGAPYSKTRTQFVLRMLGQQGTQASAGDLELFQGQLAMQRQPRYIGVRRSKVFRDCRWPERFSSLARVAKGVVALSGTARVCA